MADRPAYPGIRITTNGNQLVAYHTEARITDGGIFYPITPSTEMGEQYQLAFAEGKLNVFGRPKIAIECEGEHAAQGGAIAFSVTGKRAVNFTSGQGIVYGVEQYYHAPGKLLDHGARGRGPGADQARAQRALRPRRHLRRPRHRLDHAVRQGRAAGGRPGAHPAQGDELSLTPGINIQDGFLTSHLERTFYKHESELLREYLGAPDDIIDCPTEAQRRALRPDPPPRAAHDRPRNPAAAGPGPEPGALHERRHRAAQQLLEPILGFLEEAYAEFGR